MEKLMISQKVVIGKLLAGILFAMVFVAYLPARADTVDVDIPGFQFSPSVLNINVGQTVRWTNNHFVSHTSTADGGAWDSGIISPGGTFSFTFATAGSFPYHCTIHISMVGTINVAGPSCCIKAGDANHNGSVNIQDITYVINFLYKAGPAPTCQGNPGKYPEADANSNGLTNIQDVTYLINFLYKGGPAPNCGPM
jgi:plastocyanin